MGGGNCCATCSNDKEGANVMMTSFEQLTITQIGADKTKARKVIKCQALFRGALGRRRVNRMLVMRLINKLGKFDYEQQ